MVGPNPLDFTTIHHYCERFEIEDFEAFETVIGALDDIWMGLLLKKQERELAARERKAQAAAAKPQAPGMPGRELSRG